MRRNRVSDERQRRPEEKPWAHKYSTTVPGLGSVLSITSREGMRSRGSRIEANRPLGDAASPNVALRWARHTQDMRNFLKTSFSKGVLFEIGNVGRTASYTNRLASKVMRDTRPS